jgi:hypothetical protein
MFSPLFLLQIYLTILVDATIYNFNNVKLIFFFSISTDLTTITTSSPRLIVIPVLNPLTQ